MSFLREKENIIWEELSWKGKNLPGILTFILQILRVYTVKEAKKERKQYNPCGKEVIIKIVKIKSIELEDTWEIWSRNKFFLMKTALCKKKVL